MSVSSGVSEIVVVLGMHRSGTSLLGSVLHELGVNLGTELIAGDSNNAAGYYEHAGIVRWHQKLLDELDRRWTGPKGSLPLPVDWLQKPETRAVQAQLTRIVAEELRQARGLWGFKDPRTSRFLPLWNDIFRELGVKPLYLLAVRGPQAVAASIVKRDALSPARAQLLWLVHNLDVLRDTGAVLQGVVEFDRWFSDLEGQSRAVVRALGLPWPEDAVDLHNRLAQHVRPELRHHESTNGYALPYVTETYDLLVEAAVTGQVPAELRRIEAEVRRAQELLRGWAEVIEATPRAAPAQPPASVKPVESGGLPSMLRRFSAAARERLSRQPNS